jgi:hypothetical protein
MTAQAADRVAVRLDDHRSYIGAADNAVWYLNGLIQRNSSGYGVAAADTASQYVLGVATNSGSNTAAGHANGAINIEYEYGFVWPFVADASIDITDVGKNAFVKDDQTVQDKTAAANDSVVGIVRLVVGSVAYVQVGIIGQVDS